MVSYYKQRHILKEKKLINKKSKLTGYFQPEFFYRKQDVVHTTEVKK